MILIIGNRLRGTDGTYSKVIGLLLAYVVLAVFVNIYVSFAVGVGYIVGEALYGWGEAVGNLCVWRKDLWKWRKYLAIRGFAWWVVPISSLYFVGFSPLVLLLCLVFLSVGFPIACEIGYRLQNKIYARWNNDTNKYEIRFFHFSRSCDKDYKFSIDGATELMEVAYGFVQDVVILILLLGV